MTIKQYEKFIPICEEIISSGGFKFIKEYSNVKNAYNLAKDHFKVQKSNIENGFLSSITCQVFIKVNIYYLNKGEALYQKVA